MKKSSISYFTLVIMISTALVLTSCKKNNDNNNLTLHYQAALDNSVADGVFNRAYNQVSKASYTATNSKGKSTNDTIIGSCPVLYINAWHSFPDTVTLDYGTSCLCEDGVTRKGKIVTVITGLYVDSGTVVTSTFQNYHEIINTVDYQATGTQIITNLGNNQAGHPVFSVDVQNASVISVHGTINYTSQRQNEWIVGYNTWINPFDDEYLVTGTANGTDLNGEPYSLTITQALDFNVYCDATHYWTIKSGKFELSYPGTTYPTIYVDYGTGVCDYLINVTINGVVYPIVYY
jgi:hypothetical protein